MSASVYEAVTAHIVSSLERGNVPWRKPWQNRAQPVNAVSSRPYRGVNVFLLGLGLWQDHRWLSFKQAQQLGGHVRAGERSMMAIFWKRLKVTQVIPDIGEAKEVEIPFLRHYHVFNVEQCEGLKIPPLPSPQCDAPALRIERAEELVRSMPDPPTMREGGSSAWYLPMEDRIQVPKLQAFYSTDAFYATLFHELGHATGHEKRLNRPGVSGTVRFGSETYSREELVAELTSAFCCAHLGLDNSLLENSASYIRGWHSALKDDPKAVTIAAAQAQRAADHIRNVTFDDS
jgi:antirestriction protein ArdC